MSMSKFYIKNNVVIDHPLEIQKKKNINEYAIEMAKKNINNTNNNQPQEVNLNIYLPIF